ncbi:hypothetical protein E2I00_009567, partial [Balaenoptera physalus]
ACMAMALSSGWLVSTCPAQSTQYHLNLTVANLTIILSLRLQFALNSTMSILNFPAISFCVPYLVFKKTVLVEGVTYYFNQYDPWNEIQGRYQLWREIIIPQYQMLISGHFVLGFILPLATKPDDQVQPTLLGPCSHSDFPLPLRVILASVPVAGLCLLPREQRGPVPGGLTHKPPRLVYGLYNSCFIPRFY